MANLMPALLRFQRLVYAATGSTHKGFVFTTAIVVQRIDDSSSRDFDLALGAHTIFCRELVEFLVKLEPVICVSNGSRGVGEEHRKSANGGTPNWRSGCLCWF